MSARQANEGNNFDSLRLIFAVLVILSHSFPLGRGTNDTEPLSVVTQGQLTLGDLSVWGFFVISGFLITQSWLRSSSAAKYLKRRVGRIYPGFIVMSLVSALLIVPRAVDPGTEPGISIASFLFTTLRLQTLHTAPVFTHNIAADALNGSLWSVAFEFWCYIGVLLLGLAGLLRRRYFVLGVFVFSIAWHLFVDISGYNPGGKWLGAIVGYPRIWATVLPFFLAGMLLQLFGGRVLMRTPVALLAAALLVVSNFIPHAYVITTPTCGAYLVMWLAYLPWLAPLKLGRYGDFSYGVYLYAYPIQQLLVMHSGGSMSPWQLFALATPATLLVGALSWFLVERHFMTRTVIARHEGKVPAASSS